MKTAILFLLAGLAAVNAMPVMSEDSTLEQRQLQTTSNDLKTGSCKAVTFIMARGSTETGNMVRRALHLPQQHGHHKLTQSSTGRNSRTTNLCRAQADDGR